MPSDWIDYGSLSLMARAAGLLLTLTVAQATLWIVVRRPAWVPEPALRRARLTVGWINGTAFAAAFIFLADSSGLPVLEAAALIGLLACVAARTILACVQTARATPTPIGARLWLNALILSATGAGTFFVSTTIILMVWHWNSANTPHHDGRPFAPAKTFDARVTLTGHREVVRPGLPTRFHVSSGQVSFGCEQIRQTSVAWPLPPDARLQGMLRAHWTNLANTRSHAATEHREDQQVSADGVIQGLALQRIGLIANCPGSGHGELVLSGTYVTNAKIQKEYTSELAARVDTIARTTRLTLPSRADVKLSNAIFVFRDASTREAIDWATLDLTEPAPQARQSTSGLFEVGTSPDELMIQLLDR